MADERRIPGRNFVVTRPSVLRLMIFPVAVFTIGAAGLVLAATLLSVPALADILPYGGGHRPPPPPRPFSALEPIFLEKIRAGGFDCPQIDVVAPRAPSNADPATHEASNFVRYAVTCGNGKQFLITLSSEADASGGAVTPLN
jgi:hypothetical protein